MVRRMSTAGYGALAYVVFLAVFTYTVGFVADAGVPKGIDDGTTSAAWVAAVINIGLLSLFAVQHSVMARPAFKRRLTQLLPPAIERSTFVLAASLVLALLLWLWRPLTGSVWSVDNSLGRPALWGLYGIGWATVVGSTFLINHFDLFGLRQVAARARDRRYVPLGFRQPLLYRIVRHPIMVGFFIAFWAAPDMSAGRLLFAVVASAYILVAVRFEEHDLGEQLGDVYEKYAASVPRFVPRPRRQPASDGPLGLEALDGRAHVAQDHG